MERKSKGAQILRPLHNAASHGSIQSDVKSIRMYFPNINNRRDYVEQHFFTPHKFRYGGPMGTSAGLSRYSFHTHAGLGMLDD